MKKYLVYAGMFLGSFLVINVGMYFLLDMTQPKTAVGPQAVSDLTHVPEDSLRTPLPEMVEQTAIEPQNESTETPVEAEFTPEPQPEKALEHEPQSAANEMTEEQPAVAEETTPQTEPQVAEAEITPAIQTGDPKELAKLAKVLEGMKANEAAAIASRLDIEEIVSLLMKMKDRKAAKMLAALPVEKAARVAARMSEIVEQGNTKS